MVTITEKEILDLVTDIDLVSDMEQAFIQYSLGNAVVPPVGELLFDDPQGETHIKYGYIKGQEFYTIKIASGFPGNKEHSIPTSQGVMLLFSQKTGETKAILLDNGRLTDLRTAAAGALVARHLAPKNIDGIGVIGTGIQAKLQLEFLLLEFQEKPVWLWGRNRNNASKLADSLPNANIQIANEAGEVLRNANLIVTTTSSKTPVLKAEHIRPGIHITAMGSDTAEKQELDSDILGKADLVIADSLPQSESRGEIYQAKKAGKLNNSAVIELGNLLTNPNSGRTNDQQITVADLTGVAVQDIAIAEAVYTNYLSKNQ